MNDKILMKEIIEQRKLKGSLRKPKYATRKLSIGLVSCMLGFSLILSPVDTWAEEADFQAGLEERANAESSEESIFSADQKLKLLDAKFTEEEIKDLENEAKEKKAKEGVLFDLDEFIDKAIADKENQGEESSDEADQDLEFGDEVKPEAVGEHNEVGKEVDALSSATYYNKANWENKIKDKSRWKVGDKQTLVRVTTSEPVQMNDIDYDGNFVDANGRTVLRMVYKEKGGAATGVWYKAIFNFGELDQYIDYDKSYMVGVNIAGNEAKTGKLDPFNEGKERIVNLGLLRGDLTNQRKNLPINLVLKEGVTIEKLGLKNYIVQMRLTDDNGKKIYAYAPKGTSMDYSTYTKTTSVSLEDKVNRLFIKGGYQKDGNNATVQEFVMSEFIANPEQYKDEKNLGIIRTQYTGQTNTIVRETVGGQPIAFTQAFDANLLNYLKEDDKGNVAYVNVFENTRLKSKYSHNFGIKKKDFNLSKDKKLAYLVIGTHDFQKDGVNKVEIPQHDQYSMISGFYITGIDYVVDKGKFEDTFAGRDPLSGGNKTRKLNYSMITGWTNPNKDGWVVYEKTYDEGYTAQEGESYIIDTTSMPEGGQIMIQFGNDDAIIRKQQGYYSYYITSGNGIETIEEYAKGVFKFDLREGATIKAGDKLRVFMPYTKDHKDPVNFLEINNATKRNEGAATLTLNNDRNITMHIYKEGKKGHFVLKYTPAGGKESSIEFTPKVLWKYSDKDRILTGVPNTSADGAGGNFYINTKKLEPGTDIIVESYDEKGNKLEEQTSWFKYRPLTKAQDTVKELTWTDSSDKSSILSINKSLYTPYQMIFTNDYADGTDDFYKDPRVLPADNDKFNTDTTSFVGYTKYDGGKIRTVYDSKTNKLYAKVQAAENVYDKDGNLVGQDLRKKILIPKTDIFDAQFAEDKKEYLAYEYLVDLTKMLPYHSDDKTETKLELKKDMKFVSSASDGSSLPSDLLETRVRARVLFDANTGSFADGKKKAVKIAPDNINFYDQEDYKPNGFEGANVKKGTGDKFADVPKLEGKNFLGWVTEAGKTALGGKAVVTADEFNKLSKDKIFTNETPIEKHLVVYAVYSDELTVTFDANQGRFTDGKDTTGVKVENGSVTAPTPTRDEFTFKGWADKKDAKEANVTDFTNITEPKTYYAVWERTDKTPLTLNEPEKTVVKDKTSLTEKEQEAVEAAVIKANPDLKLTIQDVVVDDDGTVTVTKDGKIGKLTPDKTIEQKEVKNEFNPPKEPVIVENAKALTDTEKQAVKDAIKEANPGRNFTDKDIKVNDDGSVKINQNGKTGSFTPDQTVVQKDTILDLTAPEKTEVKDVTDLKQEERDKVAAAVKEANKTKLSNDAVVTVDSKGNVTVTVKEGEKTKTGKLEAKDTVKPFTRDDKKLNDPTEKVEVSDLNKLTDAEKQAVKEAVKAANPHLNLKDEEIEVANDGTVKVPMGTNPNGTTKYETIDKSKTVKEDNKNTTISLKAPAKTEVVDKTKLTQAEKDKVIAEVKNANADLPSDAKIEVADDGAVTVTSGTEPNQKVGLLSQDDTVIEKLKAPTVEPVADGSVKVIPNNKEADTLEISFGDPATNVIATKGADGNWALADGTDKNIKIDKETGTVTIPSNKLSKGDEVKAKEKAGEQVSPEAKANSNDTTPPKAPKVEAKDDGSVTVTPPTDAKATKVEVTYTPEGENTTPKTVTVTKGKDGKWTTTDPDVKVNPDTGEITIPADKVKDGTEVSAVAKDANDNASEETKDSKANAKTPSTTPTEKPSAPKVVAEDNGDVKVTPPTDAKATKVEVTYTPEGENTTPKTVTVTKGKDGNWKLPKDAPEGVTVDPKSGKITIPANKVADNTVVTAVAKDANDNASDPLTVIVKTLTSSGGTGGSTGGDDSGSADNGNTDSGKSNDESGDKSDDKSEDKTGDKDGKDSDKTDGKTDGKNDRKPNLPEDKVKVKDEDNLTDKEKNKILDEVKKANPDAKKVEMDDKGNVVLTYDDGFETSIPYKSLIAKVEPGSVGVPSRDKAHAEAPQKSNKQMNQEPSRDRRNQAGARNVKTGVGSVSGLVGLAGAALAGLFATKKKEDEDK